MSKRPRPTHSHVGAGARRGTIEITIAILAAVLVAGPFVVIGVAGTSTVAHVIGVVALLVVLGCVALAVHGVASNRRGGARP